MENSSVVSSVVLTAFYGMQDHKSLYFILFLILYTAIVFENVALICIIYNDKALHEPMYLFICNLAANNLYGSTALLPSLLNKLISYSYEVSLTCCQLQIYCIHTYAIIEFTILAVMGYDRYLAICQPLHYQRIMSITKVYSLVAFSWFYPLGAFALFFTFTLRLTFCGRVIERVYCMNYSLVKLSCSNTSVESIVGLFSVVVYTFPQLIMIVYSYAKILKICFFGSKESKIKAVKTCSPHIIAIINYSLGCFFEIIQSRFPTINLPFEMQIFMSLYFLILPPFLNPVIYGLSIQTVRKDILKFLSYENGFVIKVKNMYR
ncbi:olfactory receptor 52D1-like [Alosa sapidissima]|uniref:olfactory receptor 52D1-like n=1 Tax=Alosa sapidissima TaxID=34773 RepID=UPI001C089807|nr:olfactory receptor 52D1-like [Alosa sapidissima]